MCASIARQKMLISSVGRNVSPECRLYSGSGVFTHRFVQGTSLEFSPLFNSAAQLRYWRSIGIQQAGDGPAKIVPAAQIQTRSSIYGFTLTG